MITVFMDMHSGGHSKLECEYIVITAPEEKATEVFEEVFKRDPKMITCDCCGHDFSVSQYENLSEFTGNLVEYHPEGDLSIISSVHSEITIYKSP